MGDNTTAMEWIWRSNFRDEDETNLDCFVKQQIAKKLAKITLQAKTCLYSQWFAGILNVRGDSLSRDCVDLSSTTHGLLLQNYAHTQVPENFRNQTTSQRDCLVHWVNSVAIGRAAKSVKATKSKRVAAWRY